jgi:hypothetical protein
MLLYEKPHRTHSVWRWIASWWLRSGFFLFLGLVLFLSTSVFLIRSYDKYKTQQMDIPQTLGEIFRMVDSLQPSPAPYETQSNTASSDTEASSLETGEQASITTEISVDVPAGSPGEPGSAGAPVSTSEKSITLAVMEVPTVLLTLDGADWQGDGWALVSSETAKQLKVKWTDAQTLAKDLVYKSENAVLSITEPTFAQRFPQDWSAGSGSLGAETKITLLDAQESQLEVIVQSSDPTTTGRGKPSLRRFNIPNLKEKSLLVRGFLRRSTVRAEDSTWLSNDPVLRFWVTPEDDQTELCLLIESR